MSEIKNKFVSWTLNVVKEIREFEPPKLYGVGVSLAVSSANSPKDAPSTVLHSSRVIVSAIHPSGPASKVLKPNDIVLSVNEVAFDDKATPQDVAKLIRGPEGSTVDVAVEREGKRLEFCLRREPIGHSMNEKKKATVAPAAATEAEAVEKKEENDHQELKLNVEEDSNKEEEVVERLSVDDLPIEYKNKQAIANVDDQKREEAQPSIIPTEETIHRNNQDLTSSNESNDKFIEQHFRPPPPPSRKSFEETTHSEEKSHDELEISSVDNNSTTTDHWEILSATSGSAVVISFSGSFNGSSFRSVSPSTFSNKFIMSESTGEEYMEHVVLPTDTLQGLCLAYKLSATRLRMINNFSGNSLTLAPKKLRIPTPTKASGIMIRTQDKSSKEYKLYALCAELPMMELVEAKAYLDLSNWDLEEALRSAREDDGWGIRGEEVPEEECCGGVVEAAVRPKALTAKDVYAAPPPFEGDGFELKDISS